MCTGRTLFLFVAAVLSFTPRGQVLAYPKSALPASTPQLTFRFEPNADRPSFTVHVSWNYFPNTGFALALNDYQYSDPDSLVGTYDNSYTFFDVSPGLHYLHMKVGVGVRWSSTYHWQVNVPDWYSTSSPEVLGTSNQRNCWWFICW